MSIPDRRGVRTNAANIVRLETAQSTEEIREAILGYLRAHRNWYQKWSTRYAVSWNLLTFLILTLGALTSILTAIGNVEQFEFRLVEVLQLRFLTGEPFQPE